MKSNIRETLSIRLYSYYENINFSGKSSLLTILSARERNEPPFMIQLIVLSLERRQNTNSEVVGQQKFSTNRPKKSLSDWSITKMACPKENSLVAFNAHNHI